MELNISLLVFTLVSQLAAGMVVVTWLLSLGKQRDSYLENKVATTAVFLYIVSAVASLFHLSDPLIAFRALTNVFSSPLSQEILCLAVVGAITLAWALFKKDFLLPLSAIAGLVFVWVVSRVYTIETVEMWDSLLTFWVFLFAMLVLGSIGCIAINIVALRNSYDELREFVFGRINVILSVAFCARVFVGAMQLTRSSVEHLNLCYGFVHLAFLLLGAGFILPLAMRKNSVLVCCSSCSSQKKVPVCLIVIGIISVIIGETFGRLFFYDSYTWFGM